MVTLIADDLTGACDAGALFTGRDRVGVFVDDAAPGAEWDVAAMDTESRGLEPAAAAERVGRAVERLAARLAHGLLFKKIDSTLRGPVGAELAALLLATGRRTALICPAFPDQARTVLHGHLLVGGMDAHLSPIGQDPAYPGPTSDIADILRRGAAQPVSFLSLARVRGGHEDLARTLASDREQIFVADAEADSDLDALARAALGCPHLVLAGSAGLARAVAASLGFASPPMPLPEGRAWLILAGSLHPATRAQLRTLESAGIAGVRLDGQRDPDIGWLIEQLKDDRPVFIASSDDIATAPGARGETASRLAVAATRVLLESRPDLVAVTGGETAVALLRALGAARLELLGVPSSGLALGDVVVDSALASPGSSPAARRPRLGSNINSALASPGSSPAARRPRLGSNINDASTLPLLTKAGGFGAPDLFLTLLKGTP